MLPTDFPGTNIELQKPDYMTDEQYIPARAMTGKSDGHGFPYVVVAYMPSREDIDAIIAGSPIFIKFRGEHILQPVILLTMDKDGILNYDE